MYNRIKSEDSDHRTNSCETIDVDYVIIPMKIYYTLKLYLFKYLTDPSMICEVRSINQEPQ